MLFASMTACSNDDLAAPEDNSDEATVSFTVDVTSGIQSRSYSQGDYAKKLQWAAYQGTVQSKQGKTVLVATGETTIPENAKSTTVNMTLVRGYTYYVVFWAQNSQIPYKFKAGENSATVEMNYSTTPYPMANYDQRDAFYAVDTLTVDKGSIEATAKLKRAFAKIDVMTDKVDDYDVAASAPNFTANASKFVVSGVYSSFNLLTGNVTGSTTDVKYYPQPFKQGSEFDTKTIDGKEYVSIGSVYVLASNSGSLVNCDFTYGYYYTFLTGMYIDESSQFTFSNVPVKKNQRTIIYGKFLTGSVDYNVEVTPDFDSETGVDNDGTKFTKLFSEGGSLTLESDATVMGQLDAGTVPVVVDLNNHTLTIASTGSSVLDAGANVTFKNGKVEYTGITGATTASLAVNAGATLTLDGVTLTTTGGGLHAEGENAKLVVNNSTVTVAGTYAVATNASGSEKWGVDIQLTESTFSSNGGITLNVPGTLTMTGCTLNAVRQGLLVRGGTAVIDNSTIIRTGRSTNDNVGTNGEWGQGINVMLSAFTIGNHNDSAYQYPTNVTIKNSTITDEEGYRAMYIWANTGEDLGVTLNLEGTNTINGWVNINYTNVTVNGSFPDDTTIKEKTADSWR